MQAASTVRGIGISRSAGGFVIGLMAALVLGGVGGFTARSLTVGHSAVPATTTVVHQQAPDAVDRNAQLRAASGLLDRNAERTQTGSPSSDLTRALPTAAPFDPADWWKVDGIVPPAASVPYQVRGSRSGNQELVP
jgi:hypothetical protein